VRSLEPPPLRRAAHVGHAETNTDNQIDVVAVDANGNIPESLQSAANATTWSSFTQVDGALRP
jgi:hypothetical protein